MQQTSCWPDQAKNATISPQRVHCTLPNSLLQMPSLLAVADLTVLLPPHSQYAVAGCAEL